MTFTQRRLTKAEEMRALAHPVRLRLLDLLGSEGSFTASEAGRRLGETPSNVSWHLRKLASYGFVSQGAGQGREKPWSFVSQGLTFGDDAEDPTVATALSDLLYEQEYHVMRTSMRERDSETQEWREATAVVQSRLWLTVDEAKAIGARLSELFTTEEQLARNQDPSLRPAGARLMALMGWAVPYGPAPACHGEGSASSPRADTTTGPATPGSATTDPATASDPGSVA